MTVEVLIEKLKALESLESMTKYAGGYINSGLDEEDHYPEEGLGLLQEIEGMTDSTLITEGGRPNFTPIDQVKAAGFHVGPGEKDSFGWLTGVITTQCGKIVFG